MRYLAMLLIKTPGGIESPGVDSVDRSNESGRRPVGIMPQIRYPNQPESVSATIGAGQKLDRSTVFQLSGFSVVAHSTRPSNGNDKYLLDRIPEGKWVLHAFLERK